MFDITVWKIVNCFMITTMIVLLTKMITYKNKGKKEVVAISLWLGIYLIDILVSREVLYWLNGNTAYIVTLFKTIVYFYYFYTKIVMKKEIKKYDYVLMPILGIWAGWTAPQCAGVIIVLTIILILWEKFVNKGKIKPIYFITLAFCIVGFLIFYFAPGNYVRMAVFEKYNSLSFLERIEYRIDNIYQIFFTFHAEHEIGSVPFFMILTGIILSLVTVHNLKNEKNSDLKFVMGINVLNILVYVFLMLAIRNDIMGINFDKLSLLFTYENILSALESGTLSLITIAPYVYATFVIISFVILAFYVSLKNKEELVISTLLASFMSQFAMVMAPESEQRTTFIAIFYFFAAIAILIKYCYENKLKIVPAIILTLSVCSLKLGIFAFVLYAILESFLNKEKQAEWLFALVIFGMLAGVKYMEMVYKYNVNKSVYEENIQRIEAYKKEPSEDNKLYLLTPVYSEYGFTSFVGIQWVEESIIDYFQLGNDTVLLNDALKNQ